MWYTHSCGIVRTQATIDDGHACAIGVVLNATSNTIIAHLRESKVKLILSDIILGMT